MFAERIGKSVYLIPEKKMKRKKIISAVAGALFAALLALGVVGFVCMRSTSAFQLDSENVDTGKSAVLLQDQLITARQDESEYRLVSCGADGETLWSYEMEEYLTMLSAVGDFVYVGAGRSVFVLDQTGSLRDSFSLDYIPTGIAGNSDTIAVISSISTTKNVLSVYRVSDSGTVELTYDLDFNRKILQVSVGEDGSVLFGTGNAVFECVKSASDRYTAVKLFDAHLSFDGLYAKSREVVYLALSNGVLERNTRSGSDYLAETVASFGNGGGLIAENGNGKIAVIDYTGAAILYDATEEKIVRTFRSISSSTGISLSEDRVMVFKTGTLPQLFDLDRLSSVSFFQKASTYLTVSIVLFGIVFLLTVVFLFPKGEAKLRAIAGKLNKSKRSYLYLLPTFALLLLFSYYPIIWGFSLAFQNYMPGMRADFVGLANFVAVLKDEQFWSGTLNMLIFLATDLFKAILPPLLIAEVIHSVNSKRAQYVARLVMFLPGILPGVAATLLWQDGIFGTEGAVSQLFGVLGVEHLSQMDWLGNDATAKWALVCFGFPWVGQYLIYYGALRGIPESIYEAAELDGFSWFGRLVKIDIPMIAAQIKYIFVTTFISSIQNFSRVFITTNGAFDTNIPALELYKNITTHQNYGVASAMGIILFILIFGATLYNMRSKKESY